jgi:hypothetical protein
VHISAELIRQVAFQAHLIVSSSSAAICAYALLLNILRIAPSIDTQLQASRTDFEADSL